MKKTFLSTAVLLILFACQKGNDTAPAEQIKPEDIARAQDLNAAVVGKQWQLRKYRSDNPIDYIDTDQVVKSETDLWPYVSLWIKDDSSEFIGGAQIVIKQMGNRIAGNNAETINRSYKIAADKDGVYMDFLNYQYEPMKYRLVSFNDTLLILSVNFKNQANLISEFIKIR